MRNAQDSVIDAIVYGTGEFLGMRGCELVEQQHHSLERFPFNLDSEDCREDFRAWPFPNPGQLP